jgi:hypothetical protein
MLELGIRPQFFEGLAFELQAHAQRSFVVEFKMRLSAVSGA